MGGGGCDGCYTFSFAETFGNSTACSKYLLCDHRFSAMDHRLSVIDHRLSVIHHRLSVILGHLVSCR